MNQMKLELAGSTELSDKEKKNLRGGSWITPVLWSIAASFVNNFGDVREGFSDGFAVKPPRY